MAKKRKRGVVLDKEKVQSRAKSIGILNLTSFEIRYIKYFNIPEGQNAGAPSKAWEGEKMDKKFANRIAEVLGLPDHTLLLVGELSSPWKNLLKNGSYQSSFMSLRLVDEMDNQLIETDEFYNVTDDKLDEISVKQSWYLELSGSNEDSFFVALQSDDLIFQLAPLDIKGFTSTLAKRMRKIRYPFEKNFSFKKKDGLGWRCCTAIRANSIPMPAISAGTGFALSAQELDEFALRLMQNENLQIAVDQYEFLLID